MQPGSPITGEWLNRFFAAYYARWPVNATFIVGRSLVRFQLVFDNCR